MFRCNPILMIRSSNGFCIGHIHLLINRRNLFHPAAALTMLQVHDGFLGPVKVISNEGYLLVQRFQGVATYPPSRFISTAKAASHFGHTASRRALPLRLMRL